MNDNLYLNIWEYVKDRQFPFHIFLGGRGTGKTYSALRGMVIDRYKELEAGRKFIYMRRTQGELDMLADSKQGEGANPFKPINDDFVTNYGFTNVVPHLLGLYHRTINDDGGYSYEGEPIGYGVALSTIAKIRGLSFEDCDVLIYDEFIKEKHVNKMKGECDAFLNAIETMNRNRELKGKPPMMAILLANSNDIYNEIFVGLGIVTDVEKMVRQGKEHRYYPQRGLAVHIMRDNAAFIEKKSKTALYKLTEGTQFHDMALKNDFAYNDFSDIKHLSTKGYQPICNVKFNRSIACVYKKKGEKLFYICYGASNVPSYNIENTIDIHAFNRVIGISLFNMSMSHAIIYESYEIKEKILDVIGLSQ